MSIEFDRQLLLQQIVEEGESHFPNEEVCRQLSRVTCGAILGPSAVGKNTVIDKVVEADDSFVRVKSFTTRDKRIGESDDVYDFLPNDSRSLDLLLRDLRSGKIVQCTAMNYPASEDIYGSYGSAYHAPYSLIDMMSTALERDLKPLPFGLLVPVTLVSPAEDWQPRFKERSKSWDERKTIARLQEGAECLDYSLSQGHNMLWVNNPDGQLDEAADDLVDAMVKGRSSEEAREIGRGLLQAINDYQL